MTKSALMASTAIGLLLCIAPANAQTKGGDEKAAPSQQREPSAAQKETPAQQGEPKQKAEPKSKGAQGEMKEPGKGTAQTKPNDARARLRRQQPKDKATKGTAEKSPEPKDKATKGTAEKAPTPQDKGKGTAEKAPAPQDKATKGAASEPSKAGNGNRVQLTEEKRTNVSQTILKDRNVNRATNINVSINVGTRLPRSVHLVGLAGIRDRDRAGVPQLQLLREGRPDLHRRPEQLRDRGDHPGLGPGGHAQRPCHAGSDRRGTLHRPP